MRCMGCGADMVLTGAVPDETMLVRGFEHQTFRCFDCGVSEQRHTFVTDKPAVDVGAAPLPPAPERINGTSAASPARDRPPQAWARAVEKLRSHQAEIRQRAQEAKRTDWNIEFSQAWAQLAPERPDAAQNGHCYNGRPKDLAALFARSVRGRLRKTAAVAAGRNRLAAPISHPSSKASQEFNRFWDSLAPGSTPLQLPNESPCASAVALSLLPLPKSLSLVAVDAAATAGDAARAISLLNGSSAS